MIDLYYWTTPNGHKITIFLEETGLPYRVVPINIGKGEQFAPEFLKIAPNNRIPAIVDHEPAQGDVPLSLFESGAILLYLADKTGRLIPADLRGRNETLQWLFWQMAGLGPMAGQRNHFRNYAPSFLLDQRFTAYGANRYTNEVHRLYGVLNRQLDGQDYVAGAYSIADMLCWPWVQGKSDAALDLEAFPHLKAWKVRVGERPAVGRALEKGKAFTAELATGQGAAAEEVRRILFNQRAR